MTCESLFIQIRHPRARAISVDQNHLKWREEYNVSNIFEWMAPEKYKTMFPMELCGYDRIGHPIYVIPSMCPDVEEILACDRDEYMRFCIQNMEKFSLDAKKFSTPENQITQYVLIYDCGQINFRPFMSRRYMDFAKESSDFFNENYPELMYRAYFLYSPRLIAVLFPMMKPFIPKKTYEKFRICGSQPASWLPDLLQHIPIDQLPVRFGGMDAEFEKTAFPHLKLNHSSNSNSNCDEKDLMIEANVPAGDKLTLEYKIDEPNSILKWNFKSVNHDIGFSVHFDGKELINHGRVESHRKKQEGLFNCEKEGEYTLLFDNSYSRMRSKTIFYRVEIVSPSETT